MVGAVWGQLEIWIQCCWGMGPNFAERAGVGGLGDVFGEGGLNSLARRRPVKVSTWNFQDGGDDSGENVLVTQKEDKWCELLLQETDSVPVR